MSTTSRRRFLQLVGCSAAAWPLATPMSFAALPGEKRLVTIVLRGGMDGLDVLQPYGDPDLARLRPDFAVGPGAGAADLTGFHALHPALAPLMPLWKAGQLGFVQAVSTPYRSGRSHFDGQDILEAGSAGDAPEDKRRDGWLNRLLTTMPGADARTALAVGRTDMLILRGPAPHGAWAPNSRLDIPEATADLLRHLYHDDPLFRETVERALMLSAESADGGKGGSQVEKLFDFAAAQLRSDARIAALSLGGWDTHRAQDRNLARSLDALARGLLALRRGLGGEWDRTLVMAMTEFGRTARQNGSRGTDHGTGGTMILAGGALARSHVWGDWPGLSEAALLDRRDLMPTRDLRAYAAHAMRGLFGVEAAALEQVVFPGLSMDADPGLLA